MSDDIPVDWDEIGTLTCAMEDYPHVVRKDPLWVLVFTAKQGHEPPLEFMRIKMDSGTEYGPSDIYALAIRPDRKWQ